MRNRARTPLILGALLLLSVVLAWSAPDQAVAHSMFQSSPPMVASTNTPTATTSAVSTVTATPARPVRSATPTRPAPPTQGATSVVAPPTLVATRAPAVAPIATVLAQPSPAPPPDARDTLGYLPPPTLTAPGAFGLGNYPALAGARPANAASQTSIEESAANLPVRSELAMLIDRAVVIFGYLWLCGGTLLLTAAIAGLAWTFRLGHLR